MTGYVVLDFPTVSFCIQSLHSWGKRAAHNRAQIVYYIAENLELRHDEVAQRIANMTGARTALDCCYSSVCPTGHV